MALSVKSRWLILCAGLVAWLTLPVATAAGNEKPPRAIEGPVTARVVKVRDGDTIEVEAFIWPMQSVHVAVRLRGIDAPEKRGKCAAEKLASGVATQKLRRLLSAGKVTLTDIKGDKYFGRVLANVATSTEPDIATRLLNDGLVVSYEGGKRRNWCTELSKAEMPDAAPRG